jgi:chemotaxis-related protein WspB
MLFILFQIGPDRYALSARNIIEVLPLMNLKKVPAAPSGVAGILNYRGTPVPVIDLNEMTLGLPAVRRLSTRIILVKYFTEDQRSHALGLIAEHATNMIRRSIEDFVETGIDSETAPYLRKVTNDSNGLIQWIEVERLLTSKVRHVLFRELVRS